MDAIAQHAAARDRLCFLNYPRRFPGRPRDWKRRGIVADQAGAAATRARMVPDSSPVRLCVDRVHDRRRLAFLERRCADNARSLAHVFSRPEALHPGDSATYFVLGREFPAGMRGGCETRGGFRAHGWRDLCREYTG